MTLPSRAEAPERARRGPFAPLVAAVTALLAIGATVPSELRAARPDPPAEPPATMRRVFDAFSDLLPLSLNPTRFEAAENRAEIARQIGRTEEGSVESGFARSLRNLLVIRRHHRAIDPRQRAHAVADARHERNALHRAQILQANAFAAAPRGNDDQNAATVAHGA